AVLYRPDGGLRGWLSPLGDFFPEPWDPSWLHPRDHRVARCPVEWEYGVLVTPSARDPLDERGPQLPSLPAHVRALVRRSGRTGTAAEPAPPNGNGTHPDFFPHDHDDHGTLLRQRGPADALRTWTHDSNGLVHRYRDAAGSSHIYEHGS